MDEFVNIWRKYDLTGTGFILLSELDHLMLDLARSEDGRTLIVVSQAVIEDEDQRAYFIA